MKNNPLVTVVCLCYNHSQYVQEALNSVLNQTYHNIELIIIDDYSPDDSKPVIEEWISRNKTVQFIANENNLGNTKSFNKGLKIAKGEFVIDFAADDVLYPNCIEVMIEKFQSTKYENLGAVYGNAELISEKGNTIGYFFNVDENKKTIQKIPTGDIYINIVSSGEIICPVAMMIKKTVFDKLNGYNESLEYEDLDFWIRSSRVFEYEFVDQILCKKRVLKNSLGSQYNKILSIRAYKIYNSTYSILKSAFEKTNKNKAEDFALLKRVHHEIVVSSKKLYWPLTLKYFWLKYKIHIKKHKNENRN